MPDFSNITELQSLGIPIYKRRLIFNDFVRMPNRPVNIPTEMVRTIVAVAETGSLSKAAKAVGLSQPAVSAQVKRLQALLGGELFVRTANGTILSELGKLALQHARRMLNANDQMLRLGGGDNQRVLRVGVSNLFAQRLFERVGTTGFGRVFVYSDHSSVIRKGLAEGYIDAACIFANHHDDKLSKTIVEEHSCATTWVRSRHFVASPGTPIPIVTLPDDDWMIDPLEKNGISYKRVAHTSDYLARLSAVRRGLGLTALPVFAVPEDLVQTSDYYLPPLPHLRANICVRQDDLNSSEAKTLVNMLKVLFDPAAHR